MTGEHFDSASEPNRPPADAAAARSRRYVGIHFECCRVYARVYINRHERAYEGHCPRCARPVRLEIGPGGTDARFFTAQ